MTSISDNFLNMIFPPKCLSCEELTEKIGALCSSCWYQINFLEKPYCSICSHPFEYDVGDEVICSKCIKSKPLYDKAKFVFLYDENSKDIIQRFKYYDNTQAVHTLAKWMVNKNKDFLEETDIIAPVPLHRIRLFNRRYNQSAMLANKISIQTSIMSLPDLLIRKKNQPPQASLPKRRRVWNVKGAFSFNTKYNKFVDGKNILLIDDVMTTGATISECTKVLKDAGAKKVNVLTLARTIEANS